MVALYYFHYEKVIIMNYATSEVDIVDFVEKDITVENWIYLQADIYYMVVDELSINFINSNKYGNSNFES